MEKLDLQLSRPRGGEKGRISLAQLEALFRFSQHSPTRPAARSEGPVGRAGKHMNGLDKFFSGREDAEPLETERARTRSLGREEARKGF